MVDLVGHAPAPSHPSPLVTAAQRLVVRIEALAAEVEKLRSDNASLRDEVRQAVALFDEASGRGHRSAGGSRVLTGRPVNGRRRRGRGPKGRATPAAVTGDVVRAVIIKLGEATAAEIAAEITAAGAPVGGRAVRFLAERAGASTRIGEDGQRRYHLGPA